MEFKDIFCSSPWIHMRVNNTGSYGICRWATNKIHINPNHNLSVESPITFFRQGMSSFRNEILKGQSNDECTKCYQMDRHNKTSGRLRQLLKVGIDFENFEKSLLSSPYIDKFKESLESNGITDQYPVDWQIDLGNYCNSSCVFCNPYSSSKLATEFKKLKLINDMPPEAWCDEPKKLQNFIDVVCSLPNIKYMHFVGGETLITPAFKKIVKALISNNVSKTITLGFTTNLTVWDNEFIELFDQFEQINVGLSIESMLPINDYVRYPSKINQLIINLNKWVNIGNTKNWLIQLRTTPTCLTIGSLITLYDYAYEHNISVESCNFIENPPFFRPSVLTSDIKKKIIIDLQNWVNEKQQYVRQIVNTRDPNNAKIQVVQDAQSYINYLTNEPDQYFMAPNLVKYLKTLESNRNNSILDYLPEYEEFFRSAGY